MKIIEKTVHFHIDGPSAVALGKFDGVHKGHRFLLDKILAQKEKGMKAVVFTFDPSPYTLFSGKQEEELSTREEKRALFEKLGIDILIEFPLTFESAAMPAEVFVTQVLQEQMHTAYLAAGEVVSFGDKGKGDARLLACMARPCGFVLDLIPKVLDEEGREISSTLVRELVRIGQMEAVFSHLGEYYSFTGIVQHGKKLGRTLGMPTVNLLPEETKLLPPFGVYYSTVQVGEDVYKSITNIGRKPTVNEEPVVGVESYLYDFEGDLYGQEITVCLKAFKRPEMKFNSVDDLRKQMQSDIEAGRDYH